MIERVDPDAPRSRYRDGARRALPLRAPLLVVVVAAACTALLRAAG